LTPNTLSFNVASVNDAPVGIDRSLTTAFGGTYTFQVGDFNFDDPNDNPHNGLASITIGSLNGLKGGTLTLSGVSVTPTQVISKADIRAGNFKFNPGTLGGNNAASFDYFVQDDGGTTGGGHDTASSPATVTFNVNLTPTVAPIGQASAITMVEDVTYAFKTSDFKFTDADNNNLRAVKITQLPPANTGTLKLNGQSVSLNQFISAGDINAALLTFVPANNRSGANSASFTFQVQDDGGTAFPGSADLDGTADPMSISILAVNDPSTAASGSVTTSEDTDYAFKTTDFGFANTAGESDTLGGVKISTLPPSG